MLIFLSSKQRLQHKSNICRNAHCCTPTHLRLFLYEHATVMHYSVEQTRASVSSHAIKRGPYTAAKQSF